MVEKDGRGAPIIPGVDNVRQLPPRPGTQALGFVVRDGERICAVAPMGDGSYMALVRVGSAQDVAEAVARVRDAAHNV